MNEAPWGGASRNGSINLRTIPRSRLWRNVVSLLDENAAVKNVASASATAAEKALLEASANAVYIEAVRLLVNIPLAARQTDSGSALQTILIFKWEKTRQLLRWSVQPTADWRPLGAHTQGGQIFLKFQCEPFRALLSTALAATCRVFSD